jgi:hypothetical protein
MRENDIARKCSATLIGVAFIVCCSVLASWWMASSGAGKTASAADSSRPHPGRGSAVHPQTGRAIPLAFRPEAPGQSLTSAASPDADAVRQLERDAFQLEMENTRLRSRLDDMLNWILDNVRGTFPLPEGQLANLQINPVDEDLAVSGDIAELLRMDDEEIALLDDAFLGTRSVLQELETEQIQVDEPLENQVILNIPPYGEDGQYVREELYQELKRTLGSARFDRFLQVAEANLDEQFEYFGDVDRTLQFEALADDGSGQAQLFVRDERVIPNKDDPYRQDILALERIVTELPPEYIPYWEWLPEYVTQFSQNQ